MALEEPEPEASAQPVPLGSDADVAQASAGCFLVTQEGGGRILNRGCSRPWQRTVGNPAQGKAMLAPRGGPQATPPAPAAVSWAAPTPCLCTCSEGRQICLKPRCFAERGLALEGEELADGASPVSLPVKRLSCISTVSLHRKVLMDSESFEILFECLGSPGA